MREKQTNIRLTSEELLQVQVAAAELEMRPASFMRMLILNGLTNFDASHKNVLARLDALQSQFEKNEAILEAVAKHVDGAYLMSAAATGAISTLELPKICATADKSVVALISDNTRKNIAIGHMLIESFEAGKLR